MYPKHWILNIFFREQSPQYHCFLARAEGMNFLPCYCLAKLLRFQLSLCCSINQLLLPQDSPSLLSLMLVLEVEVEGL